MKQKVCFDDLSGWLKFWIIVLAIMWIGNLIGNIFG